MESLQLFLKDSNNWEYEEYQNLKKKDFEGNHFVQNLFIYCWITVIVVGEFVLILSMILSGTPISEIIFGFIGGLFGFGYFGGLALAFLIYPLEDVYISVYQHFSHRSKSYQRFKELEKKYDLIEKQKTPDLIAELKSNKRKTAPQILQNLNIPQKNNQINSLDILGNKSQPNASKNKNRKVSEEKEIAKVDLENEEKAIRLLNNITQECREKYNENLKILLNLRNKKVWRNIYQKDIDSINKNCDFIKSKIEEFERNITLIKFDSKKQEHFQISLKIIKAFENSRESSIINNLRKGLKSSTKNKSPIIDKQKSSSPKVENKPQPLLFDESSDLLKETTEIPRIKKRKMSHEGIIKASSTFYRELHDKKMSIGEKGELLVMEFESKRLAKEEGEDSAKKLEHISKIGDGFGYDIRSFENQKEIFIEVKTTTGDFLSGLFFTNRELEVMNKLDEQYYLYRIFEFDETKNTGRLYVFRGKQEIVSYFNFKPDTYKLEPKEGL